MWKPQLNFITLHCMSTRASAAGPGSFCSDHAFTDAYILSFGILALVVIYPYGNLAAIDAYFFGVSASTESGLNT